MPRYDVNDKLPSVAKVMGDLMTALADEFNVGDHLARLMAHAEEARPWVEDVMLARRYHRDGRQIVGWELDSYLLTHLWNDYGYIGSSSSPVPK